MRKRLQVTMHKSRSSIDHGMMDNLVDGASYDAQKFREYPPPLPGVTEDLARLGWLVHQQRREASTLEPHLRRSKDLWGGPHARSYHRDLTTRVPAAVEG